MKRLVPRKTRESGHRQRKLAAWKNTDKITCYPNDHKKSVMK